MRDRTILVGGSGRVGRLVLAAWLGDARLRRSVLVQSRRRDAATNFRSLKWDPLEGVDALCDWVDEFGALQSMVVLAGVTPGKDRDLSQNKEIAAACVTAAVAAGIPRVLMASSSATYGAGDGTPFTELSSCNPINAYGAAKLEMEKTCAPWRERGLDLCQLRIGNVAGADALLLNIATLASGQALEIDTYDNGRGPIRSYIGARTLAMVLDSLCRHPTSLPNVLNIGAPIPVSMDALSVAAGQPWRKNTPSAILPQSITLDCSLLATLHSFNSLDSSPEEMVRQWQGII